MKKTTLFAGAWISHQINTGKGCNFSDTTEFPCKKSTTDIINSKFYSHEVEKNLVRIESAVASGHANIQCTQEEVVFVNDELPIDESKMKLLESRGINAIEDLKNQVTSAIIREVKQNTFSDPAKAYISQART